jgi:hypothetical protein
MRASLASRIRGIDDTSFFENFENSTGLNLLDRFFRDDSVSTSSQLYHVVLKFSVQDGELLHSNEEDST